MPLSTRPRTAIATKLTPVNGNVPWPLIAGAPAVRLTREVPRLDCVTPLAGTPGLLEWLGWVGEGVFAFANTTTVPCMNGWMEQW